MSKIGNTLSASARARLVVVALMLICVLVFSWTSAAYARTSFVGQYGSPTVSGASALNAAGGLSKASGGSALNAAGGLSKASGGSALTAADDYRGTDPSSGAAGSSALTAGVLPLTGVLPDTGGPMLPLLIVGVLSLSCGGLLALRRLRS